MAIQMGCWGWWSHSNSAPESEPPDRGKPPLSSTIWSDKPKHWWFIKEMETAAVSLQVQASELDATCPDSEGRQPN